MTTEDVKGHIWRNTISNYLLVVLRLVLGVLVFGMIWNEFTQEELGFWFLLWGIFGYGILLDFGFGFTAQKRVAELSVKQEWDKLSRVLSTIFYSYVMLGVLIVLVGLFTSHLWIELFRGISPENKERFRIILVFLFCGLGLAFPLGLFPEMLRGQQRISLVNKVMGSGMIVNFFLVVLAVKYHWGLEAILFFALACTFIPDLICGFFAMARLPGVRIRPSLFSRQMVRETSRFSLFAYVITLSNVLLARTDQLIIGTLLSVKLVPIYVAGAKIAEIFGAFSQQLPETFSPAAAHLHAKGDQHVLRRLLVDGTRFSVMLATPVYLVCAFYMDGLLWVLTKGAELSPETFWVGQILLFWGYVTLVTQSVPKRIFMMCGHERRLMALSLGEAALNLTLSVGLVLYFKNVVGVAVASLVSTSIFGWLFLWPWAAREANVSPWALARVVLFPTWLACLPVVALVTFGGLFPVLDVRENLLILMIEGGLAFVLACAALWFFAMTALDRERIVAAFAKMMKPGRTA